MVNVRETAERFYTGARRFTTWLESAGTAAVAEPDLRELSSILGSLQALAADLLVGEFDDPDDFGETGFPCEPGYALAKSVAQKIDVGTYRMIFNPFEHETAVTASIEDDLADIYNDLGRGFALYDRARYTDALWQWQIDYHTHFGRHLAYLQTALYQGLADRFGVA